MADQGNAPQGDSHGELRWDERRRRFANRRSLRRLMDRSSLAEDKLWVLCPRHGRRARDPFTDECVMCGGDL